MYDEIGRDTVPEIPVYDQAYEDAWLEEEYEDRFYADDLDYDDLIEEGDDLDDERFFDGLAEEEIDRLLGELPF